MFRFAPYVLKCLWRHRTRTALTVTGAAVALFVFCFVAAAQQGLDGLMRDRRSERTLIVFQANRFCPFTSRVPEDYERTIAKIPGVRGAVPIQVWMNNCRASLDVVVFHGLPPERMRAAREFDLVAGDWQSFVERSDGALVGRQLARRRGLAPGDKFTIGDVTVTVTGVFSSPIPAEEHLLYAHLPFLQRARGVNRVGTVTQLEVALEDSADPDAVARQIDATFRGGPVATDTRTKGVFQAGAVGDLVELIGWANYLGYACVGLVLALVATTAVMAVQDRIREHAVLQAIGVSGPRVFGLVLSETLIVSVAGGMLGVGAAVAALAWAALTITTEGVMIPLSPSASLLLHGLLVSLAVGVVAGLLPAWRAARADIVPSLREL